MIILEIKENIIKKVNCLHEYQNMYQKWKFEKNEKIWKQKSIWNKYNMKNEKYWK